MQHCSGKCLFLSSLLCGCKKARVSTFILQQSSESVWINVRMLLRHVRWMKLFDLRKYFYLIRAHFGGCVKREILACFQTLLILFFSDVVCLPLLSNSTASCPNQCWPGLCVFMATIRLYSLPPEWMLPWSLCKIKGHEKSETYATGYYIMEITARKTWNVITNLGLVSNICSC